MEHQRKHWSCMEVVKVVLRYAVGKEGEYFSVILATFGSVSKILYQKEFVASLKEDEVTYGYLRVIYGDSQRSKFVFVTYVPGIQL